MLAASDGRSPVIRRNGKSPGRSSARELTSIQLEGSGQVPAVLAFVHRLESLGFPLVIETIQLNPESKLGMVKINLTIVILDFDQWKKEPPRNA